MQHHEQVNISFEDNSTVLNITYKDKDKKLILDVLNLISEKYKDYSINIQNIKLKNKDIFQ